MSTLEDKLLILNSLVLNAPVLAELGVSIDCPIVLQIENGRTFRSIMDVISPDAVVVESVAQFKELCKQPADTFSRGIFWLQSGGSDEISSRDEEVVGMLQKLAEYGFAGKNEISSPVFIICKNFVPRKLKNSSLIVPIESKSLLIESEELLQYIPRMESFSLIQNEIKAQEDSDSFPLKAAAAFLLPQLKKQGRLEWYEDLLRLCDEMMELSHFISAESSLIKDVELEFCEYLQKNDSTIYDLDYIEQMVDGYPEDTLFHDGENVYIHEAFFKTIVKTLLETKGIPINYLKKSLKRQGVLIADRCGYTTKLRYTIQETRYEIRMMKFRLETLPELKSFC